MLVFAQSALRIAPTSQNSRKKFFKKNLKKVLTKVFLCDIIDKHSTKAVLEEIGKMQYLSRFSGMSRVGEVISFWLRANDKYYKRLKKLLKNI